jgi:hypothetical protein
MWTYFNTPFLLQWDGVEVVEEDPWTEGDEVWRVLRAYLPGHIISHCALQRFYFGGDGLLRRHDYHVDIAGAFAAAQLTTDYTEANGIKLPTRRRAFRHGTRPSSDTRIAHGRDRYQQRCLRLTDDRFISR